MNEPEQTPDPVEEPKPAADPRRRMRELLAIPEGQRTDAQWDELNELEIQFAHVNRAPGAPPVRNGDPSPPRKADPGGMPQKPRGEGKKPKGKHKHGGKPFHKPKGPPQPKQG